MTENEPLLWKFLYPAAAVAGLLLAFWLLAPGTGGGPEVGSPAPDFAVTDLGGNPVSLKDYRGKVVLVDFWATWCTICINELPELKALYDRQRTGNFELLAVSVDAGGPGVVAEFTAKHRLAYPIAFAEESIKDDYRIFSLPSKFLIDASGVLRKRYPGAADLKEVEREIEKLLGKG